MFSNALTKQQGAIHLGTAFHLAESTGVKICREDRKEVMNNRTGTVGTESSPHNFSTHAHVYNKVEEEKTQFLMWQEGDLQYLIMDMGTEIPKDEFVNMAKQVIDMQ